MLPCDYAGLGSIQITYQTNKNILNSVIEPPRKIIYGKNDVTTAIVMATEEKPIA